MIILEETLKQVLSELKKVNTRLNHLETDVKTNFDKVNKRLGNLEEGQKTIEVGQNQIIERLDRIEDRVNATFDQTGGLSEFRTVVNTKLDKIDSDIEILAGEMGKQKLDIERLKKRPV